MDARKRVGYRRQEDLAEAVGCSQQQVSDWETSKWPVPSEYEKPLADALGVSLEDLQDLNSQITTYRRHGRSSAWLVPKPVEVADWVDEVAADRELTDLARSALLVFPRFIETSVAQAAVPKSALLRIAGVDEDNLDALWVEVLSSGYVRAVGKGWVFDLVLPRD